MWSTYGLPGHSSVNFQPAASAEGHGTRLVRDMGEVLQEMRQRGPSGLFKVWRARQHDRRELRRLLRVGRHMISDIGLTLAEALAEMNRPFWRR